MSRIKSDEQLKLRSIKPTAMRELVLDALMQQKMAVSLSDLERLFEKVDRVTLYRTLKTFEEKRLIHRIDDGSDSVKYALCEQDCECAPSDLHLHFFCVKCQHTYCLKDLRIPPIQLPLGFDISTVNMVVKGTCANCKK